MIERRAAVAAAIVTAVGPVAIAAEGLIGRIVTLGDVARRSATAGSGKGLLRPFLRQGADRQSAGADLNAERGDRAELRFAGMSQRVGIVADDPVAQEARRPRPHEPSVLELLDIHPGKPA